MCICISNSSDYDRREASAARNRAKQTSINLLSLPTLRAQHSPKPLVSARRCHANLFVERLLRRDRRDSLRRAGRTNTPQWHFPTAERAVWQLQRCPRTLSWHRADYGSTRPTSAAQLRSCPLRTSTERVTAGVHNFPPSPPLSRRAVRVGREQREIDTYARRFRALGRIRIRRQACRHHNSHHHHTGTMCCGGSHH